MNRLARIVNKKWVKESLPILFLAIFCLLVFAKVIIFQKATFYTNLDNVDQFYSWYQKLASSIHRGYLPLWDANTFSGHSFVGEFQTGVFYPINLIFCWLFGTASGINLRVLEIIVALHFFIASLGMYLFAREIKLGKLAALGSALVFAYSGIIGTRAVSQTAIFFGLSLIPLAAFFTARYVNSKKHYNLILAGFTLGMIILAGHIQPMYHGLIIVTSLLMFKLWRENKHVLKTTKQLAISLVTILTTAIITALPQLILSLQYMKNAYRWVNYYAAPNEKFSYAIYAKGFHMDPHEIANLINPWNYPMRDGNNIFIGLGCLALILIGLTMFNGLSKFKTWRENKLFIYFLIVFSLIVALGYWTFVAAILYKLPFVYQIRQLGRYLIMFHFALSMMVGILLAYTQSGLLRISNVQRKILLGLAAFSLINFIYLFLLRDHIFNLNYALQWLTVAFVAGAFPLLYKKRRLLGIALLLVIMANAYLNTRWFLPAIKADTKLPSYIKRNSIVNHVENDYGKYRLHVMDNALPVNIGNVYNIQTHWGYGATVYKPYLDFVENKHYSSREFDLLGVKYLASRSPKPDLKLILHNQADGTYLYERNDYYPKLFTQSDLEKGLKGKEIEALNRFKIKEYSDMKQVYEISLPAASTVILSEIDYPGWKALVNGQETEIETADTYGGSPLLKSIKVAAGTHTIELKYLF